MKNVLLCSLLVLSGVLCFGESVFTLEFPAKEFKPAGKKMPLCSKVAVSEANFVEGVDGKFAFQLSDDNMEKKQTPSFVAGDAFPYQAGSVEITFKVLKQTPGSKARLLHIYSPSKDKTGLLLYYFFLNEKGALNVFIQCRNKQYKVIVPARLIDNTKFNTVKASWTEKELTVFLNGEKVNSVELPAEYAADAAKPRDWSTFGLLQMVVPDGDNWANRIAIAGVKVESAK